MKKLRFERRTLFFLFLIFSGVLQASPEEGKQAAEAFLNDIKSDIQPNYQWGAGYLGTMPYEREPEKHGLWQQNQSIEPANLEQAGVNQALSERVGEQIISAEKIRPRVDELIDSKLISGSEPYAQHAAQELVRDGSLARAILDPNTQYETRVCQNSRKPEEYQCIRYLQDPIVDITPAKYSHFWCSSGNHRPDDPSCQAKAYFNPARMYQEKIVRISPEQWVSECHALEARRQNNECKVVKEECLDNAPHLINGESISRPCWKYRYNYECKYPVQVSCEPLVKQGCFPFGSKCVFSVGDKCYIFEQNYKCPLSDNQLQAPTQYVRPFCLEGECFNTDYDPNHEMLPAVAQLDIFAQMQSDIRGSVNSIFRGHAQGCNKLCLSMKDCCKVSGWAMNLGLGDCSAEEKLLAEKRGKRLCIEVGTYCAEKVPLVGCIRRKTNFCCFSSKLTKAVQAQGRSQLGMNFGDAENPECRGLTPEELSRIDFSRLDLTEVFADIQPQLKDPTQLQQRLQQNLQTIQADFKVQQRGEK